MRCDCDDRNHIFTGTIEPKDAVCAWCLVFSVGFEDVFTIWSGYGREFVCVKTRMTWVALQIGQRFPDSLKSLGKRPILFQLIQNGTGLNGKFQVK